MPQIYIRDDIYAEFVKKYGYDKAKEKIAEVLRSYMEKEAGK